MPNTDGLLIILGNQKIFIQAGILNWLILCLIMVVFFVVMGAKFKKADPKVPPKGILLLCEIVADLAKSIIGGNLKQETGNYLPFFGTLIFMMAISNISGLLGIQAPTSNLSLILTLSLTMFVLIQFTGLKQKGLKGRIADMCDPHWLLSPLNVIGDAVLPLSLTLRLFGNMLAGTIIITLIYGMMTIVLQWFAPLGFLFYVVTPFFHAYFDVFSGLIQTYIFFMLSSFFLSQQITSIEE